MRLRAALAKVEQWGGGLEAINGVAQAQLTVQNIMYTSVVKQPNAKEKKASSKWGVVRVAVENQIWMKPEVCEELWGIENEQSQLQMVKEVATEAHKNLKILQKE
ncbi:hypothetical protein FRB94_007976 [Tulasnella sp. JGI-2019a]|nr:hypothetical protein FRB94_007976 [Tulasnella sp. JGI-2019a]